MASLKSVWLLAAALCAAWSGAAQAQAYPNKPIRVLVGYAPGGSADAGARPLAKALEPLLGQPIIIVYKPGNAGGVAVCGSGSMLVVHPGTPFKSVNEVVAASKREPDKWSYGTSGVAGPHHLSGEYFKSVTGAVLLHVPYKGGGPAMADLMGGQVPMLFSSLGPVVSAAKAGKVRPLAVTSLKRSNAFPDVPTFDELGYKGFESVAWYGLMGPAGLPPEVVTRLTRALTKVGEDKAVMDQINATGCDAEILSADQTLDKIRTDSLKWSKVIKDANIKAE